MSALAAFGAALARGESEAHARDYLKAFYEHVQMLDPAARDSAITFAVQNIGDVHVTWEDEALPEVDEPKGELAIVYPARSILAEPYVRMGRCRCPAEQYRGSSESLSQFFSPTKLRKRSPSLAFVRSTPKY